MAELVPILEYLHELKAAGVQADYWDVLDRPAEPWARLPKERKAALLARLKLEPDAAVDLRVVRRRGRPSSAENVFLRIEPRERASFMDRFSRARDAMLFEPHAAGDDPDVEALPGPQTVFHEAGGASAARRAPLEVLDAVWGGDAYDVARDGALVAAARTANLHEEERYWVDEPFALVRIVRGEDDVVRYLVEEPELTELERRLMVTINRRLGDALVKTDADGGDRATEIAKQVFDLVRAYNFRADRRTFYKLGYYFLRNYVGLGRLEPVMRDANVEDVSCNGPEIPIYVYHSRHHGLATNLLFEELELNSYTIKLAQRGGKLLSVASPLVDATLPDGSRIQASLGREVTAHGSAFTIRKFREDPLTCVDLIKSGTHTLDSMAHLWLSVELKRSLLCMGATASGKTTTLNTLSQFIPPTNKIVTIEDTREIVMQQENWLAAVTRDSFTKGGDERISMYDLLRAALRQRPEYIIVGEIRGEEGLTLFQAMSTGHTCFSTMHAGSVENAVYRLENAPIEVPRVMLTSLDYFLLQGAVDVKGKTQRRMLSLTEVTGLDPATKNLRTNEVYRWDGTRDALVPGAPSVVLDQARERRGWTRSRLDEEMQARRRVLEHLVASDSRHFRDVAKAVHAFYREREEIPAGATPVARIPGKKNGHSQAHGHEGSGGRASA